MTDRKTLDQLNSDDLDELYFDIDNLHAAQESACKTVAAMHAAAVGEVCGPVRGVVEDVTDVRERAERAEAERDGAYRERARLVALIAGGLAEQAVTAPAPDIDEPGWQILYATLHGHQCSWHIAPRDADLFAHFEHVPADDPRAQWDGHTTDAKYNHIDYLARALGTPGPFPKDRP